MPRNKWYKNERQRIRATFEPDASANDPQEPVQISIRDPDGTIVVNDQTMTGETALIFYYDFTPTKSGLYKYKVASADSAIEEEEFFVHEPQVG